MHYNTIGKTIIYSHVWDYKTISLIKKNCTQIWPRTQFLYLNILCTYFIIRFLQILFEDSFLYCIMCHVILCSKIWNDVTKEFAYTQRW